VTDRELLEAAAKAAGIEFGAKRDRTGSNALYLGPAVGWWNPLTDDGDALRLAVALKLGLHPKDGDCYAWDTVGGRFECEPEATDPAAATRRAIVRAAAAMAVG
jgi:hypothetical protein